MGTMSPKDLLRSWQLEKLSPEMAIGHLIQNLTAMQATINTLSLIQHQHQMDIRSIATQTKTSLPSKKKKPCPKN